ncbi:biotin/lipoyl-binding carrier protein [uncultured Jatrophihabitans sp.]|uniref:biotin/lipoyl-binding carrier protein n=1 Tax=uncultured Jatrophihabitans sp. TaxID=1610747 RepID=UPI0035CB8A11
MATTDVVAELVGTIYSVDVATGAVVAVGDPIVVLESMKMEIPILAEVPGTVREVFVAKGDNVMEGDVLAVIEEQT